MSLLSSLNHDKDNHDELFDYERYTDDESENTYKNSLDEIFGSEEDNNYVDDSFSIDSDQAFDEDEADDPFSIGSDQAFDEDEADDDEMSEKLLNNERDESFLIDSDQAFDEDEGDGDYSFIEDEYESEEPFPDDPVNHVECDCGCNGECECTCNYDDDDLKYKRELDKITTDDLAEMSDTTLLKLWEQYIEGTIKLEIVVVRGKDSIVLNNDQLVRFRGISPSSTYVSEDNRYPLEYTLIYVIEDLEVSNMELAAFMHLVIDSLKIAKLQQD